MGKIYFPRNNNHMDKKEYDREYYLKNKEKIDAKNKKWHRENRGRSVEIVQAYNRRNKAKVAKYNSEFGKSIDGKYRLIKYRHNKRWESKLFTIEEFADRVKDPCVYCGDDNLTKGIDRINNDIGYIELNTVSCCKRCNYMKNKFTQEEFLEHINKIYKYNL